MAQLPGPRLRCAPVRRRYRVRSPGGRRRVQTLSPLLMPLGGEAGLLLPGARRGADPIAATVGGVQSDLSIAREGAEGAHAGAAVDLEEQGELREG